MSTDNMAVGLPGQQANMIPATFISRTAEAAVAVGVAVFAGSGDHSCLEGVSAGEFLGVSARDGMTDAYAEGDSVRIMTHGAIWVEISGASVGDAYTVGGASVTGSRVDEVSGGLALVRLQGTATA